LQEPTTVDVSFLSTTSVPQQSHSQPGLSKQQQQQQQQSLTALTKSSISSNKSNTGVSHHHHHHLHSPTKVAIDRVKNLHTSSHHSSKAHKLKKLESKRVKAEAKRSRVEHVVIEKRYRMKITDSLNELKKMLPGSDDKKVRYSAKYIMV